MTGKNKKKKINLTSQIFIALILGAILGIILHYFVPDSNIKNKFFIDGVFLVIGQGFIRLMQMLVVPLVFFSLIQGTMSMGNTERLGKIGLKTVAFYLFTTAMAVIIALAASTIIKPGKGMNMKLGSFDYQGGVGEELSLVDTLLNFIPTNPINSLASGNMIQIIVFAVFVGVLIAKLADRIETISNFVNEANDIMMAMTMAVMSIAPIGVFALITRTFSTLGYDVIVSMISYLITVFVGLAIQLFVVYLLLLTLFVRINPLSFLKQFAPVMGFAFSTASSNATMPLNIKTLDDMGIDKKVSSFTIPLGATVNMDGTSIMQGVAVVFIANAYGIDLSMMDYITIIFTATVASIGTAGIPSVGLVTLAMVLQSVNVPTEGIAMIMGIDRIVDMSRTAINITGDAVATTIIAHQEGMFDKRKFNDNLNNIKK